MNSKTRVYVVKDHILRHRLVIPKQNRKKVEEFCKENDFDTWVEFDNWFLNDLAKHL